MQGLFEIAKIEINETHVVMKIGAIPYKWLRLLQLNRRFPRLSFSTKVNRIEHFYLRIVRLKTYRTVKIAPDWPTRARRMVGLFPESILH